MADTDSDSGLSLSNVSDSGTLESDSESAFWSQFGSDIQAVQPLIHVKAIISNCRSESESSTNQNQIDTMSITDHLIPRAIPHPHWNLFNANPRLNSNNNKFKVLRIGPGYSASEVVDSELSEPLSLSGSGHGFPAFINGNSRLRSLNERDVLRFL